MASDCPSRKVITVIEGEPYEVSEEEQEEADTEPVYDDECTPADHEELLVIRQSLHTIPAKEESWLRHHIFYTRCTTQGKVCDIIIDSGSCENVVSNYMVDKLNLPTQTHPHPYKLQWLNKGSEIKVSKQCLVSFSIGQKYRDEVWCDVIPMDACHLLLGRPWQYDRHAIYDGYANTYSFEKDGSKITLAPLSPSQIQQSRKKMLRLEDESFPTRGECTRTSSLHNAPAASIHLTSSSHSHSSCAASTSSPSMVNNGGHQPYTPRKSSPNIQPVKHPCIFS